MFDDCDVGAIPPLVHWRGVKVLLDEALAGPGEILFQAGTHEDAIRLSFNDWLAVVKPRIDSFSEPAGTPHDEVSLPAALAAPPTSDLEEEE